MKKLLAAVQFLTRVPVPGQMDFKDIGKSTVFFPAVGLLLGGILIALNLALSSFLPRLLVDALLIIALISLAGAFHLDGLADTLDGLYAGRTKEERLKIMRDAQIGAMGAIGLICLLGLKLVTLSEIPAGLLNISLLVMPMTGRWMMVLAGALSTYARPAGGLGEPFTNWVGLKEFAFASLLPVALITGLLRLRGLLLMALVVIVTLCLVAYIKRKIGGMTGDTLGAINETIEVAVLLVMVALAGLNL